MRNSLQQKAYFEENLENCKFFKEVDPAKVLVETCTPTLLLWLGATVCSALGRAGRVHQSGIRIVKVINLLSARKGINLHF